MNEYKILSSQIIYVIIMVCSWSGLLRQSIYGNIDMPEIKVLIADNRRLFVLGIIKALEKVCLIESTECWNNV